MSAIEPKERYEKLSVIVPVFNERNTVGEIIRRHARTCGSTACSQPGDGSRFTWKEHCAYSIDYLLILAMERYRPTVVNVNVSEFGVHHFQGRSPG